MTVIVHDTRRALAAVAIALLSPLFFTFIYVLNRAIPSDGYWAWTATLRYLLTLPLLLALMPWQGSTAPVWSALHGRGCVTSRVLALAGIAALAWVMARPAAGSQRTTQALRMDRGA